MTNDRGFGFQKIGGSDAAKAAILARYKKKHNPNMHSELHLLVDELREEYCETHVTKGVGSFGYYLGKLGRLNIATVHRLHGLAKEANVRSKKKYFWSLVLKELKAKKAKAEIKP